MSLWETPNSGVLDWLLKHARRLGPFGGNSTGATFPIRSITMLYSILQDISPVVFMAAISWL
jgi:hypothetical protein